MTCAMPGPFPPSSHLPIFRHTHAQCLFHILSPCEPPYFLSSSPSLSSCPFPLSEPFLLLHIIFSRLSTLNFHKL